MKKNENKLRRRSIRKTGFDYTQPGIYFITLNTKNRRHLFGKIENGRMVLNDCGKIVREEWLKTSEIRDYVKIMDFVIMPNHFHAILILKLKNGPDGENTPVCKNKPGPARGSIGAIIGQFKSVVTKRMNEISGERVTTLWQRNFYDIIIRNDSMYDKIADYICNNPVNWKSDRSNNK